MFEIELKVRLDDCEPMKKRLDTMGKYCRLYTKFDSYWILPQAAGVRVRRESGCYADGTAHESAIVTYKVKNISGGIEVNDEREFTVSDAALFEELIDRVGLVRTIRKEKRGWAWTVPSQAGKAETVEPPILAELSLVAGLGWFLELEIMTGSNNETIVEESRRRLLTLLARLEIPETAIESRPYTVMLQEHDSAS